MKLRVVMSLRAVGMKLTIIMMMIAMMMGVIIEGVAAVLQRQRRGIIMRVMSSCHDRGMMSRGRLTRLLPRR